MATSPAWAVPVELVAGDPCDLAGTATRTVALTAPLADVSAIRLTTARLGGREVLVAVEPVRAGDGTPDGTPDGTLDTALAALRVPDRPVPVLAVGTPLQRRVLAALAAVPAGSVVTYGELAARAGAPGAARAAARVMSTNRVPLVLPCHRVVPAAGGIGAHGWGAAVKAALLAREGAA